MLHCSYHVVYKLISIGFLETDRGLPHSSQDLMCNGYVDARSRINASCGGVAHVTRGRLEMVLRSSWRGKLSNRKAY